MADYGRPRKRRRRAVKAKKKLIVGEKVEVRSIEDGFQGSWHSGVVISCQKQTRQVRYDNLLCDDGSEYLTESVDVSSVIDGIDRGLESMDYYRGRLRPSPLAMEFDTQAFHYGLCVDAYYNEAWWEGVIFDTNDGSEERKIFFPDLGDELVVGIENLRITHDWDEFTTEWRPRGNWLLLEIIKEYDNVVPVSVKQIWYDARESEKFEQIREWTYPVKNLWHDLIVKVIDDNLRIIADHFLNSFNLAEDMTENGEAMCYRDSTLNPESNLAYSGTPGPSLHDGFQNNDRTQISKARLNVVDELAENVGFAERFPDASSSSRSFLHSDDQDPCEQPKALSVVPSSPKELTCSYVHSSYEGRPCSDSGDPEWKPRRKPPRSSKKWHVHVVSEPEFCPHSITDYALSKHAGHILTRKLQKHLAYLGWKIEFTRDKGFRQIRYMSPDGKTYYQLRKVCELLGPVAESSTPPPGAQASTRQSPGHLNCHLLPDYVEPERCPEAVVLHSEHIDNMALSDYVEPQYCSEAAVQVHAGKMEKRPLIDDVEAEYCPEAVLEYLRFRNMNGSRKKEGSGELLWKARKHLKFMGWEFWIKIKRKGTEEWRYRPPSGGKIYYSLQTACKGFIRDSGLIDRLLEYGLVKDVISGWQAKSQSGGELSIFDSEFRGSAVTKDQPIKHMKLRKLRKGRHRKICKRKRKVMSRSMTSSFQSDIQHQPHSADDGFTNGLKNDGKTSPIRRLKITFSSKKLKISGASRKMRKNPGGNVRTRVLRSTKRARQLVTSNITQQSPRTVLSWLIDNNVVLPRAKVHYGSRKDHHSLAEGRITRDGIKCNCCQKVFTLSGFEAHAGGIYRRPAANIYLEDGRSLVDCQMQMLRNNMMSVSGNPQGRKKRRNQLENWNDHICSICQYGGKLILCDRCPSSFHMSCLNLQDLPEGDWFCPLCCCGICGESCFDENPEQLVDRSILCCHQCEHQYHFSCLRNRGMVKLDLDRSENWFCCRTCEKVYWGLQKLLGKPILVGHDNLTWTLVRPMQYDRDNLDESEMEAMAENYCKLNVALEVMHECFEPVIERQTRHDLVEDVIFSKGSKLNRLNFRGFYTVLLERNDELITAATVRVYGEKVAEVPLVGTRFQYRRLGMCRILMRELEKNLNEIGVEKLILPAVPSVLNAWTSSFGFAQMTHSQRSELLSYTFLDFQGTIMCHKFLRKPPSSESLTLRGVHGELDKKVEGTDGNIIDVDGNSGISEVSQEEQTDGFEIVGQAPVVNTTEGSGSDTCTNPNPTVPLVPESNVQLCEPSNIRRSPESSIELPDQKKPDGAKKSEGLKSYKRKKMVDRPPLPQADYPNVKVSCM